MDTCVQRLTDKAVKPDETIISGFIGKNNFKRWLFITEFISKNYPGVFPQNDWIYGGKKHGWCLRFKKSKSFCSLIPEKNKLLVLIVLGEKEREETEKILSELDSEIRGIFKGAKTYHDGKWLTIPADNNKLLNDIIKLLIIKRKPKV